MKASVREVLSRGAAQLQAAGIGSARLDARILLSLALGISTDTLFSAEPAPAQIEIFESLIARRSAREPLAYITGRKEFWSLEFEVGPGVLIPRPETETLIEEALRRFPDTEAPLRVLDIGTGSGCLLIAFLKERPNATGLGIDCSERALAYAQRNAALHALGVRCLFEVVEVQDAVQENTGTFARQFDVILTNPPYLTDEEFAAAAPEIRDYEPRGALAARVDGLQAFRAFLPPIAKALSPAGMAFLEIGANQGGKLAKIIIEAGLEVRVTAPDLSGIPRCLAVGRVG